MFSDSCLQLLDSGIKTVISSPCGTENSSSTYKDEKRTSISPKSQKVHLTLEGILHTKLKCDIADHNDTTKLNDGREDIA